MRSCATPTARVLIAIAVLFWAALAFWPDARPNPAPADAPDAEFSAERAMVYVASIAQRPHPVGSADHDRVRDYIRGEFTRLGLPATLQAGSVEYRGNPSHVENLVARLPGTANTRPILLTAHYDSAPRAPGAGDDGHGVAVLLETLRALKASPPLRNDVIFLVTDGEELALLGAVLFMKEHPWRAQAGVVLNFEARGTGGIPSMFETSEGNLWLVRNLRAGVPKANASSFAYEVYKRMPNNTDLTVFKAGGLAGMNFAFIDHAEFYHRPQDNIVHLDRRSVQEQGRYCLQLARQFGGQDLTNVRSGDAIYFPTKLTSLIVYPAGWAMPMTYLLCAGLLVSVILGLNRRARGLWIAAPLAVVAGLLFYIVKPAPGASYLLEWPLAAGILSFALLVTIPDTLAPGWRVGVLMLAPAAVLLILCPLLGPVIVALGWRGGWPVVAASLVFAWICLMPQLALIFRRPKESIKYMSL